MMNDTERIANIITLLNRESPIGRLVDEYSVLEAIEELIDMITNLEGQVEDVRSLLS